MPLFLWLGCSNPDIQLQKNPDHNPAAEEETAPHLVVDPISITVDSFCEREIQEQDITLLNSGEGPLQVTDVSLTGNGWSLQPVTVPFTIEAGSVEIITLQVAAGEDVLSIKSNDPTTPEFLVDLVAEVDEAPQITILDPVDGSVIPISGMELIANVQESEDPLDSLSVEWSSNVDGFIGITPVDSSGAASISFETSSYGNHELSATVYDSCGHQSVDTVEICQQLGYEEDSLDISTWHFEGSANWDSSIEALELTEPIEQSAGTAFATITPINVENVEIEFAFFVSGGSGADGFSLTALDVDRMSGFGGSTGGGLGYSGLPGWSIEVDTYHNNWNDPTSEDHIAFSLDGDSNNPQAWAALPEMEDDQWHTMKVRIAAPHVYAEIDGIPYLDTNISGNLNFNAYIGFTASTGGYTNYHLIDSLTVVETICEE